MKIKHCLWWKVFNYDEDIDFYETSCKPFISGIYKDNKVKYCPYCGNIVKEVKEEKELEEK